MADEQNEKDNPEEDLDETQEQTGETAASSETENSTALAKLLSSIISSPAILDDENRSLFTKIVQVAVGKEDNSEGKLALLAFSLTRKENSIDNPPTKEDEAAADVVQALLQFAEDPKSGLNEGLVYEELRGLAKTDRPSLQNASDGRYAYLEWLVASKLQHATEATMRKLHGEWKQLNAETAMNNPLKAQVVAALVPLEKSAKLEEPPLDMDEAMQPLFNRTFVEQANSAVSIVIEKSSASLESRDKEAGTSEVDLSMIGIASFFPGDTKEIREAKIAALLKQYPVEGTPAEQAEAARSREQLVTFATNAELDLNSIFELAAEPVVITEGEQVNPSEGITSLSTFEQLLTDEIVSADSKKIQGMLTQWEQLRDTPGLDAAIKERAERGVVMLEKIHVFKQMQEARDRGERVDFRRASPPGGPADNPDSGEAAAEMKDAKKENLAKLLAALFVSARVLNSEHERQIVATITDLILDAGHTEGQVDELLASLLSCFPTIAGNETVNSEQAALVGYLGAYLVSRGLFPDFATKEGASSVQPQDALENLLGQALDDVTDVSLSSMRQSWESLLDVDDNEQPLDIDAQTRIERAVGIIDTIVPNKPTPDALQHPLEQPVTGESSRELDIQGQFARDMRELVNTIDLKGRLQPDEKATLAIVFSLIAYSNKHTKVDNETFVAEKKIAELLVAFRGHEAKGKLLMALGSSAFSLGLNRQEIKAEETRLLGQQQEQPQPFDVLEHLLQDHVGRLDSLTPKETTHLREQFTTLLKLMDADIPAQAIAQEASALLETMIGSEEIPEHPLRRGSVEREVQRQFLHTLVDRYGFSTHLPMLVAYLDKLEENVITGSMSSAQKEAALSRLDDLVRPISDDVKNELSAELNGNADHGFMENRFRNLLAVEEIAADYKKLLIEATNKDKPLPYNDEGAVTPKDKEDFLAEVAAVNHFTAENYDELGPSRLTRYIINLEHLLKDPAQLSVEQLQQVYTALEIQDSVVRGQLTKENKFLEAIALYERVRTVRLDVYTSLMMTRDGTQLVVEDIIAAAKRNAHEVVQDEEALVVNMYRPAPVGDPRYGNVVRADAPGVPEAVHNLRDVGGDPDAILREFPGLPSDEEASVRSTLSRLRGPEPLYAEEASLTQMQRQLHQMVESARLSAMQSGQRFDLESVPGAKQLATDIMNQQIALAAKAGYRGIVEKRNEQDNALYEGNVDEVLRERMRRLRVAFGSTSPATPGEKYTPKQLHAYYTELQRWVTILLNNDVVSNPDKARDRGNLRLTAEERKRYLRIKNRQVTPERIMAHRSAILNDVQLLTSPADSGRKFLDYFMSNTPDPENQEGATRDKPRLLGVPYQRSNEPQNQYGIPESVQETMKLAADQFSIDNEADYHTGGNRALIDAEGNFQYHHFFDLILGAVQRDIDPNGDSAINPFEKIAIQLPMGQIGLYQMLYLIPQYLSERRFVIGQDADTGRVVGGWGPKLEHQSMTWENTTFLVGEVEARQKGHVDRVVKQRSTGKKEFIEAEHQSFGGRFYERGKNGLYFLLGLPSVNEGTAGLDAWMKGEQGAMGQAHVDMLVNMGYLPEIAKYYTVKDPVTGAKRDKRFNESMFYKWNEADGTMIFQTTMAEGALNEHKGAKDIYALFIKRRIEAAGAAYMERATAAQKATIKQYIADFTAMLDGSGEVRFRKNQQLSDFHQLIRGAVFDEDVDGGAIAADVKKDLLTNLKDGYFKLLMPMKVKEIIGSDKYRNLKVGKSIDFGDAVLFQADGQNVTMEDFLMGNSAKGQVGFSFEQITAFDYQTGDRNDPLVRESTRLGRDLTEAEARDVLDRFMSHTSTNHRLFKANEQMMLGFTKYLTQIDREWFNYMKDIPENIKAKELVEGAFMACAMHQRKLEKREAKYIMGFAYDTAVNWDIRGMLDYSIGYDYSSRIWHTGQYLSNRAGKDSGGIVELMDQINAMGAAYPYMLRLRRSGENARSLHNVMQGGEGGYITPRGMRKFDKMSDYIIERAAGELYVKNHIESACELADILPVLYLKMAEALKINEMTGNVDIDRAKATELFKTYRRSLRYAFQKNGVDYNTRIWLDGRETTLYNHCFGKKIREINQLIVQTTGRTMEDIYAEPTDGVMLAMFAAAIHDARKGITFSPHATITDVIKIMHWLLAYMQENDMEMDPDGDPVCKQGKNPLTVQIFDGALKSFETGYAQMYGTELASTFFFGLFIGLFYGLREHAKNSLALAA